MKTVKIRPGSPDDIVWIEPLKVWKPMSQVDPAKSVFQAKSYKWNALNQPLNPDRRRIKISKFDWFEIECAYNGSEWLVGGSFRIQGRMYAKHIDFANTGKCWHAQTRKSALLNCLTALQILVDTPFYSDRAFALIRISALAKEVVSRGTIYQRDKVTQLNLFQ
jgi:hypothetical protein